MLSKMRVTDHKDAIFENYFKRIGFTKEYTHHSVKKQKQKGFLRLATKLTKKIPGSEEYHKLFLKNNDK